MSKFGIIWLRR